MTVALIVAAGSGERLGADRPKAQFAALRKFEQNETGATGAFDAGIAGV